MCYEATLLCQHSQYNTTLNPGTRGLLWLAQWKARRTIVGGIIGSGVATG
jgi:hypothetical protein